MATSLDANGYVVCKDCRQKKSSRDVESCVYCNHFVCKSCAT